MKWAKPTDGPIKGRRRPRSPGAQRRRRRLCRAARRQGRRQLPAAPGARRSPAPSWRWTRRPAACSRWSAASPTTRASSTARPRRCASRARRSSRSSTPPRSTTATRPRPWCMDAPIEIDHRHRHAVVAAGKLFGGKFYGPSTLRFGIEQSRNVMTVRLAQDIGMPLIAEYAKRFGVYDNLPPYLSYGARRRRDHGAAHGRRLFDVRQWRQARSTPTLIDRIQDRYGRTIYKHDQRECDGCDADKWAEPERADAGRQARAGARPDDRLPDHLDDGGRGAARHRAPWSRRSASRSPARPAPPTTRRTPGSSASRPTSWSASIIGYDKPRHIGRRRDRRRARGADRHAIS